MSRVAKALISVPAGVKVDIGGQQVSVSGPKGSLQWTVHQLVDVVLEDDGRIKVNPKAETSEGWAMAGTTRALVNNMLIGTSKGFEKKLSLVGVGYRAQAQGEILNLSLGFSHPVNYQVRAGVTVTTPSQTEILVAGADRQAVGQVAAEIRSIRPPEPYKGKGVRYSDEIILRKQAKKK